MATENTSRASTRMISEAPQPNTTRQDTIPSKPSMADLLKPKEVKPPNKVPMNFQPEKIHKIGMVEMKEGEPVIMFSGDDAKYLTDKMGYTIVGKFSHSIPTSHRIQVALDGMKLAGGYTWKHINAKHIAIKVVEESDYARILMGQNGMPVWYIDRHPMRVFKWTTDFDPFFETPIAAVWCNIIGLPMHMFDEAALFVIGGVLGNPIQADPATADQSRVSFARICVEIDISKPVREEIAIDNMGKEIRLKVKWDKLPLYCMECKHVGHSSYHCYANGKREKPGNNGYHGHQYNANKEWQQFNPHVYDMNNGNKGKDKVDSTASAHMETAANEEAQRGHEPVGSGNDLHTKSGGEFVRQGRWRGAKQRQRTHPTTPAAPAHKPPPSGHPKHFKEIDRAQSLRVNPSAAGVAGKGRPSHSLPTEGIQSDHLAKFAQPNAFANLKVDKQSPDEEANTVDMEEDLSQFQLDNERNHTRLVGGSVSSSNPPKGDNSKKSDGKGGGTHPSSSRQGY